MRPVFLSGLAGLIGIASAQSPTSSGSITTASINAHPDSGTVPPQHAVLVSPNGQVNGSYPNVTSAFAALPSDSTNQTIFIYAGTYTEQIPSINRPGAVNIIGYTIGNPGQSYQDNEVTITFSRGLSVSPLPTGHSDAETATVSTASNRISFYNINIINSDNLDGSEASYVTLAGSIYGTDIGFYACYFQGWQDTLLTGSRTGYQYYESSYIEGAIDFIWGYSKAYFKGCTIGAKKGKSAMTAQSRASLSDIGGYIFDQCLFTTAADATVSLTNKVYLVRPYSEYALVVVKNSYIDSVINPSGWKVWSTTDPRTDYITFAEYNNSGPSNWENNAAARLAFGNATLLTSDTYPLTSVMDSTSWIDMTYWDSIVTPEPAVANTTTTTSPSNGIVPKRSTYGGTTPPTGALIVSKNAISGVTTYDTIQSALDAAPTSSKTNATIFIYPGVYEEQLIVNKSGTTIFMGYSDETNDYSQNQVTIQQSVGVDTQGDGSDVDSATVYVTGNNFYAYNIDFRNDNGTQFNIASLGFAVKSSKYAFLHGCQIYGNQDTLYISGSLFTFKSYIEGNVDFIFGAGLGYFLNTTISPNKDGDSITAAKRATSTTQAGFVFDQCTLVPAAGNSGFKNVSLGRPWNDLGQVVYVDSYFDSMIGAAGWDVWSKSSPQTDAVTYGEYHNYGPGSSICDRVPFSHELTDSEVVQYELANFFPSISWIDFSVVDVQPFTAGIGSAPAFCLPTSSSSTPLVTAHVAETTIDKETLYTTAQATVYSEDYFNDELYIIQAANTVTVKSTQTVFATTTVQEKSATVKSTSTTTETTTIAGKTSTVKATKALLVQSTSISSTHQPYHCIPRSSGQHQLQDCVLDLRGYGRPIYCHSNQFCRLHDHDHDCPGCSTSMVYKATAVSQVVVIATVTPAAVPKISTVKSTSAIYSTVIKTAKTALACTS
ncbi:pectin lyase fold/virulence factor [Delphinella strobiligena]|nr:pectin lyase fold/virulence factor [Delphinella strobiligena]